MEKKYGTEVFLKGLSRRLNYKGIKVIAEKQEPVDSKEDEKAAECSKELVRTSWGDILAYIQESKQCIAREGLFYSVTADRGRSLSGICSMQYEERNTGKSGSLY